MQQTPTASLTLIYPPPLFQAGEIAAGTPIGGLLVQGGKKAKKAGGDVNFKDKKALAAVAREKARAAAAAREVASPHTSPHQPALARTSLH